MYNFFPLCKVLKIIIVVVFHTVPPSEHEPGEYEQVAIFPQEGLPGQQADNRTATAI